ncbi:MAG: Gfo/Idh/MocA family protein [Bilifractor sp.]
MSRLKVCFCGVGSIARRHINNLDSICSGQGTGLVIDALRHSETPLPPETAGKICHVYTDISQMPDDYDVIFITNPTSMHLETLKKTHGKGKHFFIEKPLVSLDQLDQVPGFRCREESVYYVACPLRYCHVIRYLKEHVDKNEVLSARCISSSYLPEWRPGTDYRKTYSAHRDMGGGVAIDLIHEWDYIRYLFGDPERILYSGGKISGLEIDSDDYALYIARYRDKIVELHLDYFGRKTIREVMLMTESDTIIGDIAGSRVRYLKSGKVLDFSEERDDFQKRELLFFLDRIRREEGQKNFIGDAFKVLNYSRGVVR